MADKIQWAGNTMPKSDDKHLGIMSLDHVKKARAFHQSFPQYTVTPLARTDGRAARLGLSNLCVKDESYRFGLNAFKVWAARLPWPTTLPTRPARTLPTAPSIT